MGERNIGSRSTESGRRTARDERQGVRRGWWRGVRQVAGWGGTERGFVITVNRLLVVSEPAVLSVYKGEGGGGEAQS